MKKLYILKRVISGSSAYSLSRQPSESLKFKCLMWYFVALVAAEIFVFSAQPSQISQSLSMSVTRDVVKLTSETSAAEASGLQFVSLHKTIRKAAHFTLYTLLGLSLFGLFTAYDVKFSKKLSDTLLACLFYASSDELHQLFVPGRSASISDVCLDFSGAVFGVILCSLVIKRLTRSRKALMN